jgi:23S rRNA (guanosine2251-2'-O)-methyltransferase
MALLTGTHAVLEALRKARPLERVHLAKGSENARLREILHACRSASIPVRFESRNTLDRLAGGSAHQGVVAVGAAHRYAELDEVLPHSRLLVVLDGVEDPHNLGAVIRTAHAAGAGAVVIPERRAAGLTETVAKTAAGALEHLPVVQTVNVNRALESLKHAGFWIYGLDAHAEASYSDIEYQAPTAIVLGGEGLGLHRLVREHCDFLVRIPMAGSIPSLNVSVAAGIVLFEYKRREKSR